MSSGARNTRHKYFRKTKAQLVEELVKLERQAADDKRTDITELKKIEQKLRDTHDKLERRVGERTAELQESEERFRSVIDNSPSFITLACARRSDSFICTSLGGPPNSRSLARGDDAGLED